MSKVNVPWHQLRDVVGEAAAVKLVAAFGGTKIALPMRPRATHPIAQLVGMDGMKTLIDAFGAGYIDLPQGPDRGPAGRRRRLAEMIGQGFSTAEAARMADTSQRTAERVSSRLTADGLGPERRRIGDATPEPDLPLWKT
jgi:hypothetical protein